MTLCGNCKNLDTDKCDDCVVSSGYEEISEDGFTCFEELIRRYYEPIIGE